MTTSARHSTGRLETGATEIALRLGAALWRFWQIHGHLVEAGERLARILAMPAFDSQPPALRARVEGAAGSIAYWRNDVAETHRHYAAALDVARESDDRGILAEALYNFGFTPRPDTSTWQGTLLGAPYHEQALELYRELDDRRGQASALWGLAIGRLTAHDVEQSRAYFEQSLAAYRSLGDAFGIGWALHMLGLVAAAMARPQDAVAHFNEALHVFVASGDRAGQVVLLADFCSLARWAGDLDRSMLLAGACDSLRVATGTDLVLNPFNFIDWDLPEKPPSGTAAAVAWERGRRMSAEEAIAYALHAAPDDAGKGQIGASTGP